LRNCQAVLQRGCSIVQSHQQCTWVPLFILVYAIVYLYDGSHSNGCEVLSL
jgi:hypothetical protein